MISINWETSLLNRLYLIDFKLENVVFQKHSTTPADISLISYYTIKPFKDYYNDNMDTSATLPFVYLY